MSSSSYVAYFAVTKMDLLVYISIKPDKETQRYNRSQELIG